MPTPRLASLLTLLLPLGVAGCALMGDGSPSRLTATEVDCAAVTPDVEIDIVDFTFEPDDASVPDGGIARWTHRGAMEHTVTSGSPGDDDVGAIFDSGDLEPGDTFCLEFKGRGLARYYCAYHPTTMRDAIIEVLQERAGDGGDGGIGGGGVGGLPY